MNVVDMLGEETSPLRAVGSGGVSPPFDISFEDQGRKGKDFREVTRCCEIGRLDDEGRLVVFWRNECC
jgi:hypothetical protein